MKNNIPDSLIKAAQEGNLVLFIGAGCSIPLGLPSWKELLLEILLKLDERYGEVSIINFKNLITKIEDNSLSLIEVLNKLESEKIEYVKEAKQIVYDKINSFSNNNLHSEIHNLIWAISKKIITTNYDRILENNKPVDRDIKIFYNDNPFLTSKTLDDKLEFLYKIHGDFENPDSIILFDCDYKINYSIDRHNHNALGAIFKGKTLLFIGFSLADPYVKNLFLNIKNIYGGYKLNEHFVFTNRNDDFSEFDIKGIKIDNWEDDLLTNLREILHKSNQKIIVKDSNSISNKNDIEDFNSINELINEKIKLLKKNPSDSKIITELNDLRKKIDKLYFEELDYLKDIPEYRNNEIRSLFDSIYSSEKLDRNLLERINNIRTNYIDFHWYDRSVILSAIVCSSIHFNKADDVKIGLIVDFINDNEEKVWQKAITSLFMVLNHLGNKWVRFQSIRNKLEIIKKNPQLQEACFMIIQLFAIGYHNFSFLHEKIFDNEYFSNNPFNYFLPFFSNDENSGFISVYENYDGNIEDFLHFLNESTVPDQIKYLLCNTKSEKFEKKDSESLIDNEKDRFIENIMNINSLYYPYSIYVHELISFYKFFPDSIHKNKLKYQVVITETPIKDYLLDEVEKCKALASHFMREKNFNQAIVNLIKADSIKQYDIEILLNLARCYSLAKEFDKEILIREKISKLEENNTDNLEGFYDLYFEKENYQKAIQISNKLIEIDENNSIYYAFKGDCYGELKDFNAAIQCFSEAMKKDNEKSNYHCELASYYMFENELDLAYKHIENAQKLNHNENELNNLLANYYRLKGDFKEAFLKIEMSVSSINSKKDFAYLGTKAVIFSSMGDDDTFFELIEQVFEKGVSAKRLFPDIKLKYKNNPKFLELINKYKLKF